ncbi:hypothetical protein ABW21_db0208282 [Orbilia brochopaga]|nr:hypothetical protein ABW21_db0208282 [Drechslerella brochopaga]
MKVLLTILTLLTVLLSPTTAFGPYEAREFQYYVSQSARRVSYSSFSFYDGTSKIHTVCKYASRTYETRYHDASPLPTTFVDCEDKRVKWKYEAAGHNIHVDLGYYKPNSNYNKPPDYVHVLANGTADPIYCVDYGQFGYMCKTPGETRHLTDFSVTV